MLTIKYRDHRCSESIIPVQSVSWHEGALTGQLADGGSVTFGPNYDRGPATAPEAIPVAFVMNEAGATVARYEFYSRPFPDELTQAYQADPAASAQAA